MLNTQKKHYKIKVDYDELPLNPRTDYDNFGHMICWHSRYSLGDEHNYDEPKELFRELARQTINAKEIIDYVKKDNSETVKLEYNRSNREWELNVYCDFLKKWFTEYTFSPKLDSSLSLVSDGILENLAIHDLETLAGRKNVILPLYLYDHSGITMNTRGFHCPWDSGQVGCIYASYDEVKENYGSCSSENVDKAHELLQGEVETYDYYIRGNCYGFTLECDGEEIDSCWGFLGDFREVLEDMKAYIDKELHYLFDKLDYCCMEYDEDDENDDDEDIEF